MEKIKIGICGFGNLGKGVLKNIINFPDMELVSVFTRRDPLSLKLNCKVDSYDNIKNYQDKIDVMIMCGGSFNDLLDQVSNVSKYFNTVDSFDTHAKISNYYNTINDISKNNNHTSIISCGWDPGMFSLSRVMSDAILPSGKTYTFWGVGVSQGHSDAIRRVNGVKKAIQYTIPSIDAMNKVRNGEMPELSVSEKHTRECFVVVDSGADKEIIEKEIKTMPNYFDEYETTVNFIDEEEFDKNHNKMNHGGFVIHSANIDDNNQVIEYLLKLDSNPLFTSSVLLACARACFKFNKENKFGAYSMLDIAPRYYSSKSDDELRGNLL